MIASPNCLASHSTTKPVLSTSSYAALYLLLIVTTGTPHAYASIITIPNPSLIEGSTSNFEDFILEITSSYSINSENMMLSLCLATMPISRSFTGPLPMIWHFIFKVFFILSIASISISTFFSLISLPTNMISHLLKKVW